MADRPQTPGDVDFAARNGWDRAYETYDDFDLQGLYASFGVVF